MTHKPNTKMRSLATFIDERRGRPNSKDPDPLEKTSIQLRRSTLVKLDARAAKNDSSRAREIRQIVEGKSKPV
jgi:hypothetical protein